MNESYDLVVLGSGPGGYEAAIRAAQYGLKTALVERDELGGSCLNRGCIPTKALLHVTELLSSIHKASDLGIDVGEPRVDLNKIYAYKDGVVRRLRTGIKGLLNARGVEVWHGEGRLKNARTVEIDLEESRRTLSARHVILATGSCPAVPPIPGLENIGYWTSRTLLEENPDLPRRMVIIGGGVIGVETATILNDLGVEVVIVEVMEQLLPRMDAEVAALLLKTLKESGVAVKLGVKVREVRRGSSGKECLIDTASGEDVVVADELLVATGRQAVTDAGIEDAGIVLKRGCIRVDEHQRTNIDGVYAIGDATGSWWLAHAASAEGLAVVDHITGKPNYTNRRIMPACVYTRPEIASIGVTEAEAGELGRAYRVGRFPLAGNGKSLIAGEGEGFVKILCDENTGEILGAHIVGPRATDLIAELSVAMNGEMTIEELGASIHPHPTVSESIMEAVHDIDNLCIHKL